MDDEGQDEDQAQGQADAGTAETRLSIMATEESVADSRSSLVVRDEVPIAGPPPGSRPPPPPPQHHAHHEIVVRETETGDDDEYDDEVADEARPTVASVAPQRSLQEILAAQIRGNAPAATAPTGTTTAASASTGDDDHDEDEDHDKFDGGASKPISKQSKTSGGEDGEEDEDSNDLFRVSQAQEDPYSLFGGASQSRFSSSRRVPFIFNFTLLCSYNLFRGLYLCVNF